MDAKQQLQRARALRDRGKAAAAFKQLAPILAAHPGSSAVRWELALTLLALGQLDRALNEMGRVIDARPDFVPGLLRRASIQWSLHEDASAALADVKRALQHQPDNLEAQRLMARLLIHRGDQQAAAEALDRVLILAPQDSEVRMQRVRMLIADGDRKVDNKAMTQAIAHLDVLIESDRRLDTLNLRGILHTQLASWEAAAADFQAVLDATQPGETHHLAAREGLRRCQRRETCDLHYSEALADWLQVTEAPALSPAERSMDSPTSSRPTDWIRDRWRSMKATVRDEVNHRLAEQIAREIAALVRPPPPRHEIPEGRVGGVDRKFHRQVKAELEALGFEELADFEPLHLTEATGVRSVVRFYLDEAAIVTARVSNMPASPNASLARVALKTVSQPPSSRLIELVSEFENGDMLVADNGLDQDPFETCEQWQSGRMPAATPTAQLVQAHRQRVAVHAREHDTLPLRLDGLEDVHEQQQRLWQQRQQWRQRFGWFRNREIATLLGERHAELGELVRRALVRHLEQTDPLRTGTS